MGRRRRNAGALSKTQRLVGRGRKKWPFSWDWGRLRPGADARLCLALRQRRVLACVDGRCRYDSAAEVSAHHHWCCVAHRHMVIRLGTSLLLSAAGWVSCPVIFFVFCRSPRLIRIEDLHLFEEIERVWSEILLVHNSVIADDERLHARHAILRRRGDQSEASDHDAFDHVVEPAQRSIGTLSLENLEEVPMVWLLALGIPFGDCICNVLPDRAFPGPFGILPRQSILSPRCAHYALCILIDVVAFAWLQRVLLLCRHVSPA